MATAPVPAHQVGAVQTPEKRESGARRFSQPITAEAAPIPVAGSVAAAGSTQADGVAIPNLEVVSVTGADGTKGAVLPVGKGQMIKFHNVANANLKLYPHSGGNINGGTANAAVLVAGRTGGEAVNLGSTWSVRFTAGV